MSIVLDDVTKRFDRQLVIDKVSLEVGAGERYVLLGPSGCGKSTLLRVIAGLTIPDSGRVRLHERDVTDLPPQARNVGLVFQNYSLFRHMTVADNVEFGLRIRKVPPARRVERREELLDLVELTGLGDRMPDQLSGGQRQRVALARALAYEPSVLLLDEPFGALDARIRVQLRRSLREIQARLGVTTVLVTHDQEEAFELADRVALVDRGRVLEVAEPEVLYSHPRTLAAATFVGAGTILVGRVEGGQGLFGSIRVPIPDDVARDEGAPVRLLFRPEQVELAVDRPGGGGLVLGQAEVLEASFIGSGRRVRVRLDRLPGTRQLAPLADFGEEGLVIEALVPTFAAAHTERPWVELREWHVLAPSRVHLLAYDAGEGSLSHLKLAKTLAEGLQAATTVLSAASSREQAAELKAVVERRAADAGIEAASVLVRVGDVVEQILAEQAETLYDMLILAPVRFALTPLVPTLLSRLLRQSRIPVLVAVTERPQIRKLLLCTAAGEPGKQDVRVGGRIARRLGASASLLYIARPGQPHGHRVEGHLIRAAATLRSHDLESDVLVQEAHSPAAGILAGARELDCDLIVVGGHGPAVRSIRSQDDVTLQVVMGSDRPVLVVPNEQL